MSSPAKLELRRIMRAQLAKMMPTARAAASESIRTSIPTLPRWQEIRTVAAYTALPGEPDLHPLDWAKQRIVLLPRVEGKNIAFYSVRDAAQLRPGAFGIREPDPNLCEPASANDAEIIFVPGLAFSSDGMRLGRGRGYYDRLLASLPSSALRVGVCFSCQILPSVPTSPHDQPVNLLLANHT